MLVQHEAQRILTPETFYISKQSVGIFLAEKKIVQIPNDGRS